MKRTSGRLLGACFFVVAGTLSAALAPIYHLDEKTLAAFNDYIAKFERETVTPFVESGRLWMDNGNCCVRNKTFESGKAVIEPRMNADVASGSIHHFSGSIHIKGATIEEVRQIMEDYPDYPKNFSPDVSKGSGEVQPDSTPADEHFISHLNLETTTWVMDVGYDCFYDTHYRRIDENRWISISRTLHTRELREMHNPAKGYYPEGDDHGFLWRTNTYWFVRQSGNGIDLEVDTMTVSRPVPAGLGWWGTRRTQYAAEKMLRDLHTAIDNLHHHS